MLLKLICWQQRVGIRLCLGRSPFPNLNIIFSQWAFTSNYHTDSGIEHNIYIYNIDILTAFTTQRESAL